MLVMLFDKSTMTLRKGHAKEVRGHTKWVWRPCSPQPVMNHLAVSLGLCIYIYKHTWDVYFIDQRDLVYSPYVIICALTERVFVLGFVFVWLHCVCRDDLLHLL